MLGSLSCASLRTLALAQPARRWPIKSKNYPSENPGHEHNGRTITGWPKFAARVSCSEGALALVRPGRLGADARSAWLRQVGVRETVRLT